MSHRDDEDPLHNPVPYDIMQDLATLLEGRYVEWMDEATSSADVEHWQAEQLRVMREVRAVDPDSREEIRAHTAQLQAELAAMPRYAPDLTRPGS